MYSFFVAVLVISLGLLGRCFAQQAQPTVAPDVQQVLTQIHQVGCNAEEQASAQTIAQLQKENTDLKAQLKKLDPPKSGATKH